MVYGNSHFRKTMLAKPACWFRGRGIYAIILPKVENRVLVELPHLPVTFTFDPSCYYQ